MGTKKLKVGARVLYYGQPATVLIEPDEFGQLQIGTEAEELWIFEEEIKPIPKRKTRPCHNLMTPNWTRKEEGNGRSKL